MKERKSKGCEGDGEPEITGIAEGQGRNPSLLIIRKVLEFC